MGRIVCFFLEPTDRAEESYRRYAFPAHDGDGVPLRGEEERCRCASLLYHGAEVVLGQGSWLYAKPISGYSQRPDAEEKRDPRWPQACRCGYVFLERDEWQHNIARLYRPRFPKSHVPSPAELELTTLIHARPGAMWYADWFGPPGPDGHCLVVKTPAGDWVIDGPSSNGEGWQRTGTPPDVTVTPSIGWQESDGTWRFHAWLRAGILEPA